MTGAQAEDATPRDAAIVADACVDAARRIMTELLALRAGALQFGKYDDGVGRSDLKCWTTKWGVLAGWLYKLVPIAVSVMFAQADGWDISTQCADLYPSVRMLDTNEEPRRPVVSGERPGLKLVGHLIDRAGMVTLRLGSCAAGRR